MTIPALNSAQAELIKNAMPANQVIDIGNILKYVLDKTSGVDGVITVAPISYLLPALGVGKYGTPVVDTKLIDNIAFTVNMSTGTNKTTEDTSCMAAFIGVSNTAATTNNKLQGLLVSNSVNYNCFDAYAVQGHTTVGTLGVSTKNVNAHITGLSGKVNLVGAVGQGWVTGSLAIIEGAGAVTGLCHVIAGVLEAGAGANVCDALLYISAGATVPNAIEVAGTANCTSFLKFDAAAGCVAAATSVAPSADGVKIKIMVGSATYYIRAAITQ